MKKILLIMVFILNITVSFAQDNDYKIYLDNSNLYCNYQLENGIKNGLAKCSVYGELKYEIPYKNNQIDGIVKEFYLKETLYSGGKLKVEIPYKNDKREGIVKKYYPVMMGSGSGALEAEIPYKNDKKEGVERGYHTNGFLEYEITYINNKREGIHSGYRYNRTKEYEIPYKNDKREGIAKEYYENGKLFLQVIYKNGEAVSGKCGNGRQMTNAEISNWERGITVYCDK